MSRCGRDNTARCLKSFMLCIDMNVLGQPATCAACHALVAVQARALARQTPAQLPSKSCRLTAMRCAGVVLQPARVAHDAAAGGEHQGLCHQRGRQQGPGAEVCSPGTFAS